MQEDVSENPLCPRIVFSDAEINSFYKPWSKALIVKILEKTFSFLTVKRRLEALWARTGRIQVSDMANDFFLVRFSDSTDYQRAAFDGPWNVAVTRIGNYIGKTVRLDLATTEGTRARYARVCVELDLTKPLLGKYIIDNRILRIEYESLENICFTCGTYGHKLDRCPTMAAPKPKSPLPEPSSIPPTHEGDTGEWMTVCRRNKHRNNKSSTTKSSGSRFVILTENESTPDTIGMDTEERDRKQPANTLPQDAQIPKPADSLKRVLEAALAQGSQPADAPNLSANAAEALKEVTNTPKVKSPKRNTGGKENCSTFPLAHAKVIEDVSLVSVPITYHNPVFQSSPDMADSIRTSHSKQKVQLSKAKQGIGNSKVAAPMKKTTFKASRRVGTKPHSIDDQSAKMHSGSKTGKPPESISPQ
ncbi:hypothetical protein LINPERHAP1_LOCUS8726 [Linum perenne]